MKKVLIIFVIALFTASIWAQSPEKMSYQAVVRDASNNLVTNTNIGIQISILQGSITGSPVYIERHFPTTNENGLVTLEIGTGVIVNGSFSSINWANDIYFIKTEIDLNGGASYTISSVSQLLSVPYAFHAKTAESITGEINETDPVYSAWDKSYNDLTNKPNIADTVTLILDTTTQFVRAELDADPSNEIQTISRTGLTVTLSNGGGSFQDSVNIYTAGNGIDITGTTISEHKYQIGDFAQGGIVFWVDETGEHGLVCAKQDQSTGIRWYAGTYTNTMASGTGPYAGEMNTIIIIANQGNGDGNTYAARICNELKITENGKTYGDWYLPSSDELYLMYQNRLIINATATANGGSAFANTSYWSSTSQNDNSAIMYKFSDDMYISELKSAEHRVRAIRAF